MHFVEYESNKNIKSIFAFISNNVYIYTSKASIFVKAI